MEKQYIPAILKLTELLSEMDLVALKHGVTYYYWIIKFFDIDKQDEISNICDEYGLRWDILPAPFKNTNGKSTSTGNRLIKLGHKRKPLTKGAIPKEEARAKLIIHKKK